MSRPPWSGGLLPAVLRAYRFDDARRGFFVALKANLLTDFGVRYRSTQGLSAKLRDDTHRIKESI